MQPNENLTLKFVSRFPVNAPENAEIAVIDN
jgi:hypothetical protein